MEGFKQKKIITPETEVETRDGKIEEAEMSVKSMFDKRMEAVGVIRSIDENPYFENVGERNL